MASRKFNPLILVVLVPTHLVVTSLAWRDIRDRPDDRIRGSKKLWRMATASNMTWSLAYLLFGRKRGMANQAAPAN
jgi:hypothetical protein